MKFQCSEMLDMCPLASVPRPLKYGDGFPKWAIFTPSGMYLRNVRRTRAANDSTKREISPTDDAFELHYVQCSICQKFGQQKGDEWSEGCKLEPHTTWWTPFVLNRHTKSTSHENALLEQQRVEASAANDANAGAGALPAAMEASQVAAQARVEMDASQVATQTRVQMAALVRTIMYQAANGDAFWRLPNLVALQAANGANVPDVGIYGGHTSPDNAVGITTFISDMEKEDITKAVEASSFWTFVVDGSSDKSMEHCVAVYVIWLSSAGRVFGSFWDMLDCDGDATAQYSMLREEFVRLDISKVRNSLLSYIYILYIILSYHMSS